MTSPRPDAAPIDPAAAAADPQPRRRGRRRLDEGPALDRERLLDALMAIAASDGVTAINMRRVASDLGVSPRLIYHHVRDKDEMLLILYDVILARNLPELSGLSWEETLKAIAASSREAYTPYPGMGAAILARTADSVEQPYAAQMRRAVLNALAQAGLRGEQIEEAYLQFSIITLGSLVLSENIADADERRIIPRKRIERIAERSLELLISDIRARAGRLTADG